ncbi:hypothetical protein RFI_22456 [Reticulomyxa filosa]|uniref:Reverse transcriptase domain-containing protein n=1 Tax=Reticulomyxa filosa TaxID=46433 RepID=X6MND2_RETFI|nr:hypothetical protein RFI_22456 [Reticulomyxa filosa]|eukprot:ETO14912.1 hypothetical protein RFI_22456 [Reticulomyxa filosa]
MGFGFTNAPATFQRIMISLFGDMDDVDVYIDDILIASDTEESHLNVLIEVFNRFSKYNLKLAIDKCEFFQKEVIFLGHVISSRLLGLVQLIAKFISNLATLIVDLTKLLRKNSKWKWNKIHDKAFEQLKHAISHVQLLRHPKQNEPFIVQCDASNEALGAALLQNHDGILVSIEFISKQFDSHQLKWHTSDK